MAVLRRLPRWIPVLVLLAAFGLVRLPVEDRLRNRLAEANLLLPPPGQSAMEQMSQSTLMGTLAGLRSLVATGLVLEAFDHFSHKEWDALQKDYAIVTNLEPRDEHHWVSVVWHLGINATADMQTNRELPEFERKRRFHEYALEAVALAERGIEQLPGSVAIRLQLAEVYREKLRDPCAVARVYGEIMKQPGAPGYAERFHGYFLADCPGEEERAYRHLMRLYRAEERHHKGTLITKIHELEEKLGIPPLQRIPREKPERPEERRLREREAERDTLPGGIVVP